LIGPYPELRLYTGYANFELIDDALSACWRNVFFFTVTWGVDLPMFWRAMAGYCKRRFARLGQTCNVDSLFEWRM
jgi:hypothetical protein